MRILLYIILLFTSLYAFKVEKEVQIAKHTFTLVKESYNEYGDKGVTMALYTKDANKSISEKFSFILRNESGSCSDKSVEEGIYKIDKDSIVTYTHWKRSQNLPNSPIGDRMQIYKMDENNSFYLYDSKVYVERTTRGEDADEGMKYLYVEPKTEDEKRLLSEYINAVENIFKAKFVTEDEARALSKEVHEALMHKEKQRWQ